MNVFAKGGLVPQSAEKICSEYMELFSGLMQAIDPVEVFHELGNARVICRGKQPANVEFGKVFQRRLSRKGATPPEALRRKAITIIPPTESRHSAGA